MVAGAGLAEAAGRQETMKMMAPTSASGGLPSHALLAPSACLRSRPTAVFHSYNCLGRRGLLQYSSELPMYIF